MDADEPYRDPELEAALEDALGQEPHSTELRHMQALLKQRRLHLVTDLEAAAEQVDRARLTRQLAELDEQISVLGEEANITKFIEDSVRVGIEMRRLDSNG